VVDLVYVVGNELEATKSKLDSMNKEKESLCTKMEHVKVLHESMTTMKQEEKKQLHLWNSLVR